EGGPEQGREGEQDGMGPAGLLGPHPVDALPAQHLDAVHLPSACQGAERRASARASVCAFPAGISALRQATVFMSATVFGGLRTAFFAIAPAFFSSSASMSGAPGRMRR